MSALGIVEVVIVALISIFIYLSGANSIDIKLYKEEKEKTYEKYLETLEKEKAEKEKEEKKKAEKEAKKQKGATDSAAVAVTTENGSEAPAPEKSNIDEKKTGAKTGKAAGTSEKKRTGANPNKDG